MNFCLLLRDSSPANAKPTQLLADALSFVEPMGVGGLRNIFQNQSQVNVTSAFGSGHYLFFALELLLEISFLQSIS